MTRENIHHSTCTAACLLLAISICLVAAVAARVTIDNTRAQIERGATEW